MEQKSATPLSPIRYQLEVLRMQNGRMCLTVMDEQDRPIITAYCYDGTDIEVRLTAWVPGIPHNNYTTRLEERAARNLLTELLRGLNFDLAHLAEVSPAKVDAYDPNARVIEGAVLSAQWMTDTVAQESGPGISLHMEPGCTLITMLSNCDDGYPGPVLRIGDRIRLRRVSTNRHFMLAVLVPAPGQLPVDWHGLYSQARGMAPAFDQLVADGAGRN